MVIIRCKELLLQEVQEVQGRVVADKKKKKQKSFRTRLKRQLRVNSQVDSVSEYSHGIVLGSGSMVDGGNGVEGREFRRPRCAAVLRNSPELSVCCAGG